MIPLMYRSFGCTPPADLHGARLALVWLLALGFVVSAVAMLAVFNVLSLFFGVFVNFLGRDGVKFTFLHLFRRIPVIGFAPVVLAGYAFWQNAHWLSGWELVMAPVSIGVAAVLLMAAAVLLNTLLGRRAAD